MFQDEQTHTGHFTVGWEKRKNSAISIPPDHHKNYQKGTTLVPVSELP